MPYRATTSTTATCSPTTARPGGHLLILASASPLSLIKAAPLSPADVNVLWNAAEPSRNLDEILRRALRHEE